MTQQATTSIRLRAYVSRNPGHGVTQITQALGITRKQAQRALHAQTKAGAIYVDGYQDTGISRVKEPTYRRGPAPEGYEPPTRESFPRHHVAAGHVPTRKGEVEATYQVKEFLTENPDSSAPYIAAALGMDDLKVSKICQRLRRLKILYISGSEDPTSLVGRKRKKYSLRTDGQRNRKSDTQDPEVTAVKARVRANTHNIKKYLKAKLDAGEIGHMDYSMQMADRLGRLHRVAEEQIRLLGIYPEYDLRRKGYKNDKGKWIKDAFKDL